MRTVDEHLAAVLALAEPLPPVRLPLDEAAGRIHDRLIALFRPGPDGRRPGTPRDHPTGPLWDAHPTFAEYFDGDTGRGCGASHQTGWTALVAHLICTRP